MKPRVMSEAAEQEILVRYLEATHCLFTHVPLGAFIRSPAARARAKRAGVRPGCPDLIIITPRNRLVFIELKRKKGGRVSPEQKVWISALGAAGISARVCLGAQDAIAWLEGLS